MNTGPFRPAGLGVVALFVLAGCARAVVVSAPAPPPAGLDQRGLASWYGHAHRGKRTASGEVYDPRDLTAAHRTLPLGTRLMVTNVDNGRAVEVRVNDRGPFVEGRIIDLSYGAASLLGAAGRGVIPVRIRVISLAGTALPVAQTSPTYSVQLGAFTSRARADDLREAVKDAGSNATISEAVMDGETFYRVRVGPYPDRPAAEVEARRLAARGYGSVIVSDR